MLSQSINAIFLWLKCIKLISAVALPQTPQGEYTALPQTPSWISGA